ncbi:MAG: hypothetical protein ACHP7N_00810 [Caulobacterales bacterium]
MTFRKLLIAAASLAVVAGGATAASADTPWQQHHPRREEVNQRLGALNRSIGQERREGDLTGYQAFRLHQADNRIRFQERRFASFDGGHITRGEQWRLNREESHLRRHIPG